MKLFARLFASAALTCMITVAHAQSYPSKPIKLIVPLPPGSTVDVTARALGYYLAPVLGQPIVVENRVGANGTIAMDACSKAPPDGYTLCITEGNIMTLNPFAYSKLPYDPLAFVPIVYIADFEQSIAVNANVPVRNMHELIEYARSKPGQVVWGSGGPGSTMHLYLEWLQAKTGVRFNHVPYKGPPDLVRALASGEVEVTNLSTSSIAPFVREGKVRMIAVIAGEKRSMYAGNTPTFAEQGFDLDFRNWAALWFPKGTPTEFVRRWNVEVNKLLADKEFVNKVMATQALTPAGGTPEDLAVLLERKRKLGADLARISHLKFD